MFLAVADARQANVNEAIARKRIWDFHDDRRSDVLGFRDGALRETCRHGLHWHIRTNLDSAVTVAENKQWPLFHSTMRKTKQMIGNDLTGKAIRELVKQRLNDAKLPRGRPPLSTSAGDHRSTYPGCAA
jgi:hypothetical protein